MRKTQVKRRLTRRGLSVREAIAAYGDIREAMGRIEATRTVMPKGLWKRFQAAIRRLDRLVAQRVK